MLTRSEKKWCKKRQKINNSPLQEPWVLAPEFIRMAFNEMHEAREAANFEAQVAAKLAAVFREITHVFGDDNPPLPCKYCPANACCKLSDGCDDGILKWAYIAVEEEMDG